MTDESDGEVLRRLSEVYLPEGADIWLHAPNRGLGGERPIDLLVAGDIVPVIEAIERLAGGAMG